LISEGFLRGATPETGVATDSVATVDILSPPLITVRRSLGRSPTGGEGACIGTEGSGAEGFGVDIHRDGGSARV
jgi:hypothetical protein